MGGRVKSGSDEKLWPSGLSVLSWVHFAAGDTVSACKAAHIGFPQVRASSHGCREPACSVAKPCMKLYVLFFALPPMSALSHDTCVPRVYGAHLLVKLTEVPDGVAVGSPKDMESLSSSVACRLEWIGKDCRGLRWFELPEIAKHHYVVASKNVVQKRRNVEPCTSCCASVWLLLIGRPSPAPTQPM